MKYNKLIGDIAKQQLIAIKGSDKLIKNGRGHLRLKKQAKRAAFTILYLFKPFLSLPIVV